MLQVTRQRRLQTTELFLELCGFSRNQCKRWKQDRVLRGMFSSSKLRGFQGMFFCLMPKVSLATHLGSLFRYDMHNIVAVKLLPDHFSLFNYRDALCLEKTEEEALLNFIKAIKNAIEKSRFVNINWYMHNLARTGN